MSEATTGPCLICNKADSARCGRCQGAFYCSKDCQKADWPIHKLLCTAFKNFDMSRRPSKEHVRAIWLPADRDKPEVFWLYCERQDSGDDDDPIVSQWPDSKYLITGERAYLGQTQIQVNMVLGRNLSDIICLCYRDTFTIDGSRTNQSIAAITSTKPVGPNSMWCGDMTAYGTKGLECDGAPCRDMDMNDFRHLADHLISYGPMDLGYDPRPCMFPYKATTVQGVRINCMGDTTMFDRPRFEPVQVDHPSDPVFYQSQHEASTIAKLVEIPVFARKLLPNLEDWAAMRPYGGLVRANKAAEFLHLICAPPSGAPQTVGNFHPHWKNAGSVLVVRQDKKSISALHVEALSDYCERAVVPILARAKETPLQEDQLRSLISPREFLSWWDNFCQENKVTKNKANITPYKV